MREDTYYVVGGAALGAIVGGLIGWAYLRRARQQALTSGEEQAVELLDRSQVIRLGWSVVGVIRQILELT